MSIRLALPAHRNHITKKVIIASPRTLYLSIHDDNQPAEIFLRVIRARLLPGIDRPLRRGCSLDEHRAANRPPLEKVGELLTGAQFPPCGPMSRHDRIKHLSSLPDRIVRNELIKYCDRDLAHMPRSGRKRPRMTLSNA